MAKSHILCGSNEITNVELLWDISICDHIQKDNIKYFSYGVGKNMKRQIVYQLRP